MSTERDRLSLSWSISTHPVLAGATDATSRDDAPRPSSASNEADESASLAYSVSTCERTPPGPGEGSIPTSMSTRKLIFTSLVLGVVILVAFAVQVLIAT